MHPFLHFIKPELMKRARFYQSLTTSVRGRLPPELAAHCWVGGIRGHTLVIITDSAGWAVLIRYQQHELLKQLNVEYRTELCQNLTRIKIKVAASPETSIQSSRKIYLSAKNARTLASTAAELSDPELSRALTKLAKRAAK